jgi:hypothetical protein
MLLEAKADVKATWESASCLFSLGGHELLSAQNIIGLTCLDLMPAGCKDVEAAATWIKFMQARDEQCHKFVRLFLNQKDSKALVQKVGVFLERCRGEEWKMTLQPE